MIGDEKFEETAQAETYFTLQVLWILSALSLFATIIGWLIWRMVVGGVFEWVLGFLVLGVLLCIMVTGIGTAVVILLEGRPKSTFKPVSAEPRVISSDRWTIVDPLERRGSF